MDNVTSMQKSENNKTWFPVNSRRFVSPEGMQPGLVAFKIWAQRCSLPACHQVSRDTADPSIPRATKCVENQMEGRDMRPLPEHAKVHCRKNASCSGSKSHR